MEHEPEEQKGFYAYLVTDKHGREEIAHVSLLGIPLLMTAENETDILAIREAAQALATQKQRPLKLVRFTGREEMDEIQPKTIPCKSGQYVLDADGNPVRATDLLAWGKFMENIPAKQVALHRLPNGVQVSTIFTGLDMAPLSKMDEPHEPILWQTLVTGGKLHGETQQYRSRSAAEAGHAEMLERVKQTS